MLDIPLRRFMLGDHLRLIYTMLADHLQVISKRGKEQRVTQSPEGPEEDRQPLYAHNGVKILATHLTHRSCIS